METKLRVRLGIDTGGTYTDAVLLGQNDQVLASAKSLTTRHDLSIGIGNAVEIVLRGRDVDIALIGLSTTLATNAIVERRGGSAGLIVAGLSERDLQRIGIDEIQGNDPIASVQGGHNAQGLENEPLDLAAAAQIFTSWRDRIDSVAITSRFAVRNHSHELKLAELAREVLGLPCTCSHELSARLDAPRRALTTLLNARLIPEIERLLTAVMRMKRRLGITAPLMVVRGDGSLMNASVARDRPVETILSGPAASVVGARHMTGLTDALVTDVGGTTTDVALLRNGAPFKSAEGASIAGHRTMVQAIALATSGLGGDSAVTCEPDGSLSLGPGRIVPISLLATTHPEITDHLNKQVEREASRPLDGRFAMLTREPERGQTHQSKSQQKLVALLQAGPATLEGVIERHHLEIPHARLVQRGWVIEAGFTPSDAAHILGLQSGWSIAAARQAAELELRKTDLRQSPEEFASAVLDAAKRESARALVEAVAGWQGEDPNDLKLRSSKLAGQAIEPVRSTKPQLLEMSFKLNLPVIAVGGPARLFYSNTEECLGSQLILPKFAEVCNAIGAVVGDVELQGSAVITAQNTDQFTAHLGAKQIVSGDLDVLVEQATHWLEEEVRRAAIESGATQPEVTVRREDVRAQIDPNTEMVMEVRLHAVARGRPPA